MRPYACAIIGGGAAGLTAAVRLSRTLPPGSVAVLEKLPRVGKKLLATGNGTCNLTNSDTSPARYHGDTALAGALLARFSPADTVAFFEELGLVCIRRQDGRYYPRCEQAAAVLDCLRLALAPLQTAIACDTAVNGIRRSGARFSLQTSGGTVDAEAVLLCTGGAAAPALGGSTDGYGLLTALGHVRTPLFPSLVQLRTDTTFTRAMKGVRVNAAVTLCAEGAHRRETGEVLFTDYGLSGPAILQVSRLAADWERQKRGECTAALDLFPELAAADLKNLLSGRRALPARTLEDFFTGLLQKRVGQTLLRSAGLPLSSPVETLTPADTDRIAALAKRWVFPVTGTQGFGGAQVTAGGIDTAGFDADTLQSRLVPGLFAAGEVLNIDGDCGGFNLQYAFSSAAVAADGILQYLKGRRS